MPVPRRAFLSTLSASAAWLALAGCRSSRKKTSQASQGRILGFGKGLQKNGSGTLYVAALADLDERSIGLIELPFFGHGFARHPVETHRAIVFEKKGPGCCEIDLREGRVTRTIPAPAGHHFYGHGAFAADGKRLFLTQSNLETYEGRIAVLDGASLEETGTFPSFGSNPHECRLVDGSATLVVTNGGSAAADDPGSVVFVDAGTRKLVRKLVIPDASLNAGHVAVSEHGDVIAISAPRDGLPKTARGGVSIRPKGGDLRTMKAPDAIAAHMVGESLSVALDEEGRRAAVTNPDGDLVTVWDLEEATLETSLSLAGARGITTTLDGRTLVVSHGDGKLSLLPWDTLKPGAPLPLGDTPFSGSHLYTLTPA